MKNNIIRLKVTAILLTAMYVALSLFPCVKAIDSAGAVTSTKSNISYLTLGGLGMQLLLILLNRPVLQLFAGLVGKCSGILCPLAAWVMNELSGIVHVMPSENGPLRGNWNVTAIGWLILILSWGMIAWDVFLLVQLRKFRKSGKVKAESITEDRDEVIQ